MTTIEPLFLPKPKKNFELCAKMDPSFFGKPCYLHPVDYSFYKKDYIKLQTALYGAMKVSVEIMEIKNPRIAKRALRELDLLMLIKHRNVIKLLHAYSQPNLETGLQNVCFVTKYKGHNLTHIKKLTHHQMSFLLYQVLCGVNYLHKLDIIHCDLKPSNLAISGNWKLKILNFGSLRRDDDDADDASKTKYFVSRSYRAPEVLLGLKCDCKLDIWSIGCVFVELVLKRVLFAAQNHPGQWEAIIKILGSPDEAYLNNGEFLKMTVIKAYLESLPKYSPMLWDEILPYSEFQKTIENIPDEIALKNPGILRKLSNKSFRCLISKMLVIDPQKRISAHDALQHSYVSMFYDSSEVNSPTLPISYNGGIENVGDDLEKWNEILYERIATYFPSSK